MSIWYYLVCTCRSGAYTTLNEYVGLRRRAAAAQVAAASQAGGSSGPMLQDFPEFMLPYIIQVCQNTLGNHTPALCSKKANNREMEEVDVR